VISSHWPDVAEITDGQTILPFWYGSAAYLAHLVSPWVFWLNPAHVAKIRTMARPNSLDIPPMYTKELRVARYNHHHKTTTTKKYFLHSAKNIRLPLSVLLNFFRFQVIWCHGNLLPMLKNNTAAGNGHAGS